MTQLNTLPTVLTGSNLDWTASRLGRVASERQRPGFIGALVGSAGAAIGEQSPSAWIYRSLERRFAADSFDVGWTPDEKEWERITAGIPEDYHDEFTTVYNRAEAELLRSQLLDKTARRRKLAEAGYAGIAAEVGAAILDPTALSVGVLSGGIGWAEKGSRITRMVRSGLIAGATEAGIEGALATMDPGRDHTDVLFAGAFGFILGGGIAGIVPGDEAARLARGIQKEIEARDAISLAAGQQGPQFARDASNWGPLQTNGRARDILKSVLTEDGRKYFREVLDDGARREYYERLIAVSGLDPDVPAEREIIDRLMAMDPDEAIDGFDFDDTSVMFPTGDIIDLDDVPGDPNSMYFLDLRTDASGNTALGTFARRDFASILNASEIPAVRDLVSVMVDDSLMKKSGLGQRVSATTWKGRNEQAAVIGFFNKFDFHYQKWADAKGLSRVSRALEKHKSEFEVALTRTRKLPDGARSRGGVEGILRDAANDLDPDFKQVLDVMKANGVKGAENVEHSNTYVPRRFEASLARAAAGRFESLAGNDDVVAELLSKAYMVDVPDDVRVKVGKGMAKAIRDLDNYTDWERTKLFAGDPDTVASILREEGVDDDAIDAVMRSLRANERPDSGSPQNLKMRTKLNESASIRVRDRETGQEVQFSVGDLVDESMRRLFQGYVRDGYGAAAEAAVLRSMGVGSFDTAINRVIDQGNKLGIPQAKIAEQVALLRTLHRAVKGMPLTPNSKFTRFSRVMRAIQYIRLSGGFALAQLGEVGGSVMSAGFRTTYRSIPALGSIVRGVREGGQMSNGLLRFIELYQGLGGESKVQRMIVHTFDAEYGLDGTKFGRVLDAGQRAASTLSGLNWVNRTSQMWTAVMASQRWVDMALGGRRMSARRIADLGMSEDDFDRVLNAIRTEAAANRGVINVEGPLFGRRVQDIDVARWEDQRAAALFIDAVSKWSRRVIQQNDIGNIHPFMVTEFGKIITQFKTFAFVSQSKQLAHRIQMRDAEAFLSAMGSAVVAALVYVGQQSLRRFDDEEERQKALSTESVILAGIQRGGWSAFLPDLIDTASRAAGQGNVFSFRTSGLSTGFWSLDANPSTQFVNRAVRAVSGLGAAATGTDDFDQADMRAITDLSPFRRLPGVSRLIESLNESVDD